MESAAESESGPEAGDIRINEAGRTEEYRDGRWVEADGLLDELLGPDYGTPTRVDPLDRDGPQTQGSAW